MGLPAILVGVFNTTSIFSNYSAQIPSLTLVNGAASFIATVLSGLQNYFDLSRLVNTHLKLANGYNKIVHMIEKIHNNCCLSILWVQYFAVMPGNDLHSNLQIDVMRTQNLTILHALNGHRLGAGEMHVQIQEHFRDIN